MTVIETARELFQEAGLAFPAIPQELALRLKEVDHWLYSSRPIDVSPYELDHFVDESQTDDYVVLAHSGHGANSYAIQYYLVYRCLRMFLHLGWGGVYMEAEAAASTIRKCFALADRLVQQAELSRKLSGTERLTVVISDFYGSYWAAPGQERPKAEEGRGMLTVKLSEAVDWLASNYDQAGG